MKKIFTMIVLFFSVASVTLHAQGVIISELCDPRYNYANDRYIEIYNTSSSAVDLTGWTVVAVGNGSDIFTWTLSGNIASGDALVCGDATTTASFTVDFTDESWSTSNSTWNGKVDDGAKLYNASSTLIDDASTHGNFENKTSSRNADVENPTTTFASSEWTSNAVDDAGTAPSTPGTHTSDYPSSGGVLNPTAFSASAGSTANDIDLSWTLNGNNDNVMVAYNTSNTFGVPTNGSAYSVGNSIAGGGEVVYNGSGESYNHSSLTANTTYYYKAWSVDGSTDYSSGVETNATTLKAEPTDHFNTFMAMANATTIDLTWMDAAGGTEPDGYLIRANKTGTFTAPVDGTDEADATDTNGGTVNISQGVENYSWTGLDASTQYYFKAWAYTNSGSHINYKTDGTVPTANATTGAAAAVPDLIITEIMQNPDVVGDNVGEWFEIYNNEDSDVDINGYTIKDDGTNTHTISSSVVIPTKGFVVLGNNDDSAANGGLTVDYQYSSYTLGNGADEVVLVYTDGTTEVDRVNYDNGATFPDPNGASMILGDLSKDNSVGENWKTSTLREGSWGVGGAGDKGSPGEIGSEVVLPVELTSFTAVVTDAGVMLNWTTATEVNNHGFEIQRLTASASPVDKWETIDFVDGHGNSNSPKDYSYFDAMLVSNELSYRLRQVDSDGNFEYSDVIIVEANRLAKTELFQNHPNPFNPSTKITFSIAKASKVSLSVYNVLGQNIANLVNQNMEKGNHTIDFRATNLSSGFYFYHLETPTFSKTMKMILLR